jgi:hypothetical protein
MILPVLPLVMMFAGYTIAILEERRAWEADSAADAHGLNILVLTSDDYLLVTKRQHVVGMVLYVATL